MGRTENHLAQKQNLLHSAQASGLNLKLPEDLNDS